MTARARSLAPWLLLGACVAVATIGAPAATVIARAFFVAVLGGAAIGALGVVGRAAQLGAAGLALLLTLVQVTVARPIAPPPPSQWTVELRGPPQRIRHTVVLPLGSAAWQRWWARAPQAAVYVCARGPLDESDGVDLYLGADRLARLTQSLAFGPRPQPTSVGFYRVPVARPPLERSGQAVFELRRTPEAAPRPIDVCGTFSHVPTGGLESSQFFDGATWTSPGPAQRGRYVIELRIEESPGRALAALY